MHKAHHFDVRNTNFLALDLRPPVPLSDGLDTRPCKILDPRLVNRDTTIAKQLKT